MHNTADDGPVSDHPDIMCCRALTLWPLLEFTVFPTFLGLWSGSSWRALSTVVWQYEGRRH